MSRRQLKLYASSATNTALRAHDTPMALTQRAALLLRSAAFEPAG